MRKAGSLVCVIVFFIACGAVKNGGESRNFNRGKTLFSITSLKPESGPVGTSVTIGGTGFRNVTGVSFNGASAVFAKLSSTVVIATVPANAKTGRVYVFSNNSQAVSPSPFTVTVPPAPAPIISSFAPTSGTPGATVLINGDNFSGATRVSFNGTSATFSVVSETEINTVVPAGAATGPLTVATAAGSATSLTSFTVSQPASPPAISSFTPVSGPVGTSVTITGTNFTGAVGVTFNGVGAPFTVVSATSLRAQVPAGAETGVVKVVTAAGSAVSLTNFDVTHYVDLSWSFSGSGSTFNVYRSGSSAGPWTRLNSSSATTYRDNNVSAGGSYAYTVTAVDASGNESARSNVAQVVVP